VLFRSVTQEQQVAAGEKSSDQSKKDANAAFNLFTDVAVQQSEVSKFAAKLQEVDINEVNKEAQDIFNIFKRKK
jgi:hypothetical protein